MFGRGGEEIEVLKSADIPFDIVPGISSSIAVPELAGIPVTHRNLSRSVHIITGHTAQDTLPENIKKCAETDGTLVFLMGLRNLPTLWKISFVTVNRRILLLQLCQTVLVQKSDREGNSLDNLRKC